MKTIPVIDLSSVDTDSRMKHVTVQVAEACSDWGFFQIVNHGVTADLVDRVWDQTYRFFALPRIEKLEILRSRENPRGFYDRELTKNARDLKEVFDFGWPARLDLPDDHPANRDPVNGCNLWPQRLPEFRSLLMEYFAACEELAFRLLPLFSLGLNSPADAMDACFRPAHTSFMRLNYYPLADPLEPELSGEVSSLGDMALHHHSDAGAFTILLQDRVGGLQVFAKGRWWDIEPLDGAFVINTADMMQVWSNDRYRAPLHRVLPIKNEPRYSIPFFFNPSYQCDCAPLNSLIEKDEPHYRPVNWAEFRQRRTNGDYADYGKEIQLDDYRFNRNLGC